MVIEKRGFSFTKNVLLFYSECIYAVFVSYFYSRQETMIGSKEMMSFEELFNM